MSFCCPLCRPAGSREVFFPMPKGFQGDRPPQGWRSSAGVPHHATRCLGDLQKQPWLECSGSLRLETGTAPALQKTRRGLRGWWDVLPPHHDLRDPWRLRIAPAGGAHPPDGATMGALSGLGGSERGPSAGSVTPQEFSHVRGKICLLSQMRAGCYSGNRWLRGASSASALWWHPRVSPEPRVWCHAVPMPSSLC